MKPIIGVSSVIGYEDNVERSCTNTEYTNSIIKAGGAPILIPVTPDPSLLEQYADMCDGFLFTGGIDISPFFFGEQPSPLNGETSMRLDNFQVSLARIVLERRKPYLGICRGLQLVNVVCGGTLYQDIREFKPDVLKHQQETDRGDISHLVTAEPGSRIESLFGREFWINSHHHQSVKAVGKGLKVTAAAPDGIIEALEAADYPYGVSVQWHPEVMLEHAGSMLPLFEDFIAACKR